MVGPIGIDDGGVARVPQLNRRLTTPLSPEPRAEEAILAGVGGVLDRVSRAKKLSEDEQREQEKRDRGTAQMEFAGFRGVARRFQAELQERIANSPTTGERPEEIIGDLQRQLGEGMKGLGPLAQEEAQKFMAGFVPAMEANIRIGLENVRQSEILKLGESGLQENMRGVSIDNFEDTVNESALLIEGMVNSGSMTPAEGVQRLQRERSELAEDVLNGLFDEDPMQFKALFDSGAMNEHLTNDQRGRFERLSRTAEGAAARKMVAELDLASGGGGVSSSSSGSSGITSLGPISGDLDAELAATVATGKELAQMDPNNTSVIQGKKALKKRTGLILHRMAMLERGEQIFTSFEREAPNSTNVAAADAHARRTLLPAIQEMETIQEQVSFMELMTNRVGFEVPAFTELFAQDITDQGVQRYAQFLANMEERTESFASTPKVLKGIPADQRNLIYANRDSAFEAVAEEAKNLIRRGIAPEQAVAEARIKISEGDENFNLEVYNRSGVESSAKVRAEVFEEMVDALGGGGLEDVPQELEGALFAAYRNHRVVGGLNRMGAVAAAARSVRGLGWSRGSISDGPSFWMKHAPWSPPAPGQPMQEDRDFFRRRPTTEDPVEGRIEGVARAVGAGIGDFNAWQEQLSDNLEAAGYPRMGTAVSGLLPFVSPNAQDIKLEYVKNFRGQEGYLVLDENNEPLLGKKGSNLGRPLIMKFDVDEYIQKSEGTGPGVQNPEFVGNFLPRNVMNVVEKAEPSQFGTLRLGIIEAMERAESLISFGPDAGKPRDIHSVPLYERALERLDERFEQEVLNAQ